jgi:myo-inositol 2-dehydrogenase / D-chiro-inositol 1-dehydrogenase
VGAEVAVAVDVDVARAKRAVETIPSAFAVSDIGEAFNRESVDAVLDVIRYLTGEEIKRVQVRLGRTTRFARAGQHDPQQVLIETLSGVLADVEIFGNAQFGYQVATQAVFEKGVVNIGEDGGPHVRSAGRWGGEVTRSYIDRFKNAYFCSLMISTMASSSYD